MIYELSNPSDPITLEADSDNVAIIAAILIGRGQYGLTNDEGKDVLPIFLFAGWDELEKWLDEEKYQYGQDFVDEHRAEIVACLRSTMVASLHERRALDVAFNHDGNITPEERSTWNDQRRSSMNDIAGYANRYADEMEKPLLAAKGD